jgi:predicted solute-binding protein
VISVENGERVDETVVIHGTEEYILGRLRKLGMQWGQVIRTPPPVGVSN